MTHGTRTGTQGLRVLLRFEYPKIIHLTRFIGVVLFLISSSLLSQTSERPLRFGGSVGYGSNISRTYIEAFSGDILCGVFEKGSAPGLSFFGLAEIPLPLDNFSIMPRLGYRDLSSAFTTKPFNIENARDISSGGIFQIDRERDYQTNLTSISVDASLAWRPIAAIHFAAGFGIGIFIHHSYEQSEKLLTSGAVYSENNLSTRQVKNGQFDVNTFASTLELGAGYDFAFQPNVTISPEFRGSLPITPITSGSGSNYRTWTWGGAISLIISMSVDAPVEYIPPPVIKPVPLPPPIAEQKVEEAQVKKNVLQVTVNAVGMTESGEEVSEPVVAIENVRITDVTPTLNYLFFDDGSSEIPKRYHSYSGNNETISFDPSSLHKLDALGIHYEVLNILGKRMQDKPSSKITITGTRSLHSSGDSAASSEVSLLRAEHVSKYLQDVWAIAPSRIKIKSRGLPEQASDENAATGQAENRRIEITTNTPSLLEPIETHRLERIATPPNIKFKSNIVSNYNGLKSQIITIRQGGKIIKTINGLAGGEDGELLWNIAEGNVIENTDSVTWQMVVVDSSDATVTRTGSINIKKQIQNSIRHTSDTIADKSLERFHLLLFDYSSSAELGSLSHEILERIASSITPDSRVSLSGHTDITGDPNYNEHLSYERASRASLLLSSRLHKRGISAPSFNLEARGAKDILFDNTNAEGRFLSRTVRITIERDLK